MAQGNWLTLMEYSNRHKVSISTLRRKIKSNDLKFQFADGKYYILDDSLPTQRQASGPETIVPPQFESNTKLGSPQDQEPQAHVCQTAETLLQEVKRAYSMVLQEKEELIFQLREEVSDLQTLVRVLENEVERLNENASSAPVPARRTDGSSTTSDLELNLELDRF